MTAKESDFIRVIVKVSKEGHPELYEDLLPIPQKFRAERLRSHYLKSLQGVVAHQVEAPRKQEEPLAKEESKEDEASRVLAEKRVSMKQALRGTFEIE